MDHKADAQPRSDVRRRRVGRYAQNRRGRQNVDALQISKARDQRVGKPQANTIVVRSIPEKKQWQHGKGRARAPPYCLLHTVLWCRRRAELGVRITGVNHAHRADESIPLPNYGFQEARFS